MVRRNVRKHFKRFGCDNFVEQRVRHLSESTVVLLDTGTPGTSREIFSENADGETRTRKPSVIN